MNIEVFTKIDSDSMFAAMSSEELANLIKEALGYINETYTDSVMVDSLSEVPDRVLYEELRKRNLWL